MPFCPNCDRRLHEGKCSHCDVELPDAVAGTKASEPPAEAGSKPSGAPLMFAPLLQSRPEAELEPEAASLAVATEAELKSTASAPDPVPVDAVSAAAASSASIEVATKASRDNAGSPSEPPVQRDQLGSLPRLNTGELNSLMKSEAAAIAKAADVKQAVLRISGDYFGGKVALWVGLFGAVDEHARDEFIDNFVATAIGVTVDKKRSMSRKSSGTKYTCHPLKGGLYDGAVCTWTDQDFFGAVVSLSGITVRETIKLAQASWDR